MWLMKTLLTSGCTNQRGAGQDPGGHHNDCNKILEGAELNEAYGHTWDHDGIVCEDCREQSDYDEYRREKFMRD